MDKNYICLLIVSLFFLIVSCSNDMEVVQKVVDTEEEPDLMATDINVLYTDSARLQMKLSAPLYKQYAEATNARKEFTEGIHVWFYENTGELKAEIRADWAKNDETTNIWEARNNVVLLNDKGEKMETDQLFWDQVKGEIYSDKFTKYTSPSGTVATGRNGMRANQDFSEWKLLSGKATIVLEDQESPN